MRVHQEIGQGDRWNSQVAMLQLRVIRSVRHSTKPRQSYQYKYRCEKQETEHTIKHKGEKEQIIIAWAEEKRLSYTENIVTKVFGPYQSTTLDVND